MTRLETLSKRLATKLRRAKEDRQRSACLVACEFAVQRTGLESPIVVDALRLLRASKPLPADLKAAIDALVGRLDDEYFDLQEAAEEGRATDDDFLRPFGQARAAAALSFAADRDASEAIYEAASATDAQDELVAAVMKVLE